MLFVLPFWRSVSVFSPCLGVYTELQWHLVFTGEFFGDSHDTFFFYRSNHRRSDSCHRKIFVFFIDVPPQAQIAYRYHPVSDHVANGTEGPCAFGASPHPPPPPPHTPRPHPIIINIIILYIYQYHGNTYTRSSAMCCVHGDRTRYFVVVVVLCSGGAGWECCLNLGFLGWCTNSEFLLTAGQCLYVYERLNSTLFFHDRNERSDGLVQGDNQDCEISTEVRRAVRWSRQKHPRQYTSQGRLHCQVERNGWWTRARCNYIIVIVIVIEYRKMLILNCVVIIIYMLSTIDRLNQLQSIMAIFYMIVKNGNI